MTSLIVNSSDFSALLDLEEARLEGISEGVQKCLRSSSKSAVAIGNFLLHAKRGLTKSDFKACVEIDCGVTMRTAQTYMRAAELVQFNSEAIALLSPTSIFRLAAADAPAEAVVAVLVMLEGGYFPREGEVNAVLGLARRHGAPG